MYPLGTNRVKTHCPDAPSEYSLKSPAPLHLVNEHPPPTKNLYFDPGREVDSGLKNEGEYIRENLLKYQKQGHQKNNNIQSKQWRACCVQGVRTPWLCPKTP